MKSQLTSDSEDVKPVATITSTRARMTFGREKFVPVPVAENARARVLIVCFEPGQFIPVHRPGVDLTLVVLEGEGQLVAGEQEQRIGPGTVAFVPAGQARGVKAESRLVAVTVVTPPPTETDHVEVAPKLRAGTWR